MTDLEITRLCSEAMGVKTIERAVGPHSGQAPALQCCDLGPGPIKWYDPLHDDAQAMALVKRFDISISRGGQATDKPWWSASVTGMRGKVSDDLNRAICEWVAKMQAAK